MFYLRQEGNIKIAVIADDDANGPKPTLNGLLYEM